MEIISEDEASAYSEGITGSHLVVGGMDQIINPLHVSSSIGEVLKLSTAIFRALSNLIWSWTRISDPSEKVVRLRLPVHEIVAYLCFYPIHLGRGLVPVPSARIHNC